MTAPDRTPPRLAFADLQAQYRALKPQIDARIQRVLEHGQYIMGPEVRELEQRLEQLVGARHCVTVASGTEALLIALMALGIRPGDELITTAFSFAATAEVIVLLGAVPVYADVEPDTCNIDAARVEHLITERTRVIMPVSLYGQCADMDAIAAIASRHRLFVVEDGAQSLGATYQGRRSGNLSTLGCTSFFPSKPLGCYGDGGAIFTSDDALAQACREIRVHGQSGRYRHTRLGVGGRMDTLQCAILLAKLERFEWELQRREHLAQRYRDQLRAAGAAVEPPIVRSERTSAWAQFTVQVDHRPAVIEALDAAGVPTAVHYPLPLPSQPAFADARGERECPISARVAQRVLSLPLSADLSEADQDRVLEALVQATRPSCRSAPTTAS